MSLNPRVVAPVHIWLYFFWMNVEDVTTFFLPT